MTGQTRESHKRHWSILFLCQVLPSMLLWAIVHCFRIQDIYVQPWDFGIPLPGTSENTKGKQQFPLAHPQVQENHCSASESGLVVETLSKTISFRLVYSCLLQTTAHLPKTRPHASSSSRSKTTRPASVWSPTRRPKPAGGRRRPKDLVLK